MSRPSSSELSSIPRRGLLLGAGASVIAAASLGAERASAETAPPASPETASPRGGGAAGLSHPEAFPATATLASAPTTGYTYRHATMFDFSTENGGARKWTSGGGVWASPTDTLHATIEIPAGARIRDLEWYTYNASGASIDLLARLWLPGSATLYNVVADSSVASTGTIAATKVLVPDARNGPFPVGAKLYVMMFSDGPTAAVNEVRVGFDHGAASTGLLESPVRAFDSRSSSKIGSGAKRVVTLPASLVPPGVTGLILSVTVLSASAAGSLKLYAGAGGVPIVASSVKYPKTTSTTAQVSVAVSADRKITLAPTKSAHVVVDVIGTIA